MDICKDRFLGKTIVITGATSGIGRAAALRAGAEGANVVVHGRNEERGKEVVDEITKNGGKAIFVPGDLTQESAVENLMKTAVSTFGDVTMFVNNAGMASPPDRVDEYSTEQWLRIIDVNLNSVFYCCRAEIQHMMEHGKGGAIVNIGSTSGLRAFPSACGYVASKHAVNGLTKAIAMEYAHKNIRCNSVNPAGSSTALNQAVGGQIQQKLGKLAGEGVDPKAYMSEWITSGKWKSPIGRDATPEDQANAILFLLSDDASYITGVQLAVDGGWTVY